MCGIFGTTGFSLPQGIQYGSGREEATIVCFRCGECCIKYQVRLSLIEARRLADELELAFDDWLDRYVDKHWQQPDNFVLRQRNGACTFLKHVEGSNTTRCLIHNVKPSVCQDWTPSLYRRECREGLSKYWGLTVSPFGQLEGTEEKLRDFYAFLKTLTFSNNLEPKCTVLGHTNVATPLPRKGLSWTLR